MQTPLDNRFATIEYDEATKTLTLTWTSESQYMFKGDFKDVLEELANQCGELGAYAVVIDVRDFLYEDATEPELIRWRADHIVPQYNESGLQKMAFLHGEDFAGFAGNGRPIEGENFLTKHFSYETDMRNWLYE